MDDTYGKAVWGTKNMDEAVLARQALLQLADESGMTYDELLDLWAIETASQLSSASAALAAGNLREAARLVHSASGASGICRIVTLADELKTAENLAKEGRGDAAARALEKAQQRFTSLNGALHNGTKS